MKENNVTVDAVLGQEAAKLTAENKHVYVWPSGLYVIVDNSRSVLETRAEAVELISQIQQAADRLWPPS